MFKKNKIKEICGNCKLYCPKDRVCSIIILFEGEKKNIPVDAEDLCFFKDSGMNQGFIEDVQEVKLWTEDEDGKKIDGDGIVKIEYPKGFYGDD